jgi:putative ABC transport system permease protein
VLPRLLTSLLYGASRSGGLIWLTASALLLVLSFLASYIPARRAMRLDPVGALRSQ